MPGLLVNTCNATTSVEPNVLLASVCVLNTQGDHIESAVQACPVRLKPPSNTMPRQPSVPSTQLPCRAQTSALTRCVLAAQSSRPRVLAVDASYAKEYVLQCVV